MKFVLLGRLGPIGLAKPSERSDRAHAKAKELGITVLNRYITVGRYDYCTVIEAPTVAAASAFDHWYSREGLGDLEMLLVHDDESINEMEGLLNSK